MNTETMHIELPASELGRDHRKVGSWLIAGAIGSAVFASGFTPGTPLPTLAWAAGFAFLAAQSDCASRRIPNVLTFGTIAAGLLLGLVIGGVDGLVAALLGTAIGFAILLLPYAAGAVGAGDVKALMALGALLGGTAAFGTAVWAMLAAGAFCVAWITLRGELLDFGRRMVRSVALSLAALRPTYVPPAPDSGAAKGIPFAVALGSGLAAFQLWGFPW
jgi:prepilin peptidase CpaA